MHDLQLPVATLGIPAIMEFRNEILGECYYLLNDSKILVIKSNLINQMEWRYNLHSCDGGYVYLGNHDFPWIRIVELQQIFHTLALLNKY